MIEKANITYIVRYLKRLDYYSDNDVINIACGKYDKKTIIERVRFFFRRFKKDIIWKNE